MTHAAPRASAAAWQLLPRLLTYSRRRWSLVLGMAAAALPSVALAAALPWPTKVVVDNVLRGAPLTGALRTLASWLPGAGSRSGLLAWCGVATVLLFCLKWLADLATHFVGVTLSQRLTYDLAEDILANLQQLSLRFHSSRGAGDTLRRTLVDSAGVAAIVTGTLVPVLLSVTLMLTVLGVMWALDSTLLLLAGLALPLMGFAIWRLSGPMIGATLEQQNVDGELYAQAERALESKTVVHAFQREASVIDAFGRTTATGVRAALAATSAQLRFSVGVGLAAAVPTALVMWLGARNVLSGGLTLGGLLVFLAYLETFYGPVHTVVYAPDSIHHAAASAQRVLEVLEAEPEVVDRPGARRLPTVRGHLALEHVTFGYEPDRPVLHGIDLEARPGQTIAIVGPSGAGKSTLLSLVPRFHDPWSGHVLLDGHDLRDIKLHDLRAHVSLVLQEPFLFPMSIGDNIAYGRPDASRDQVEQAARDANAHEFISRLPDGYDSVIGERGATLSGGERQRISIARALLKDAPLLLLDEPTSALDNDSERLLLTALRRLMAGRTTLIIAHRLSTIRNADHIVVLDHGHVVETGTHTQLLAQAGHYARLHNTPRRHTPRAVRAAR